MAFSADFLRGRKKHPTLASEAVAEPESRFQELMAHIAQGDFLRDMSSWSNQIDQWILDYLSLQDPSGCPLPLSLLFDQVSQLNTRITKEIIQEKIRILETREGLCPPLPFCWISMGSDARGEQVIRTDQDNALIYADPLPGQAKDTQTYFLALATEVCSALDAFGFVHCKGKVMASHSDWCRPLGNWLETLDDWVGSSDPMAIRKLTILLDFKAVFGDKRLAAMLQSRVFQNFLNHPSTSHFLARDDQLFAPPKRSFNRINAQRKYGGKAVFNLKTQAIAHLVNGARLFAVNNGIQIPSTLKRLEGLAEEKIITQESCDAYTEAFIFLTRLKLTYHLKNQDDHLPDNCIDVANLDSGPLKELKTALDAVSRFQKHMHTTFNQAWMNFFN